jgi:hypothetical protein
MDSIRTETVPACSRSYRAVAVFLGTRLLASALGDAHTFYCEPAVPWRIEIAIFGSFAIAFLTRMAGLAAAPGWLTR